jgi:hypothetical protein
VVSGASKQAVGVVVGLWTLGLVGVRQVPGIVVNPTRVWGLTGSV